MLELLAAGVPINSTTLMLTMVAGSAIAAVLIAANLLSMRHRSTNLPSIIAVILVIAAVMVTIVTTLLNYGSKPGMLRSWPVLLAVGLYGLAFLLATASLFQFTTYHRYRRGKKRAVGVLIAALCGLGYYAALVYEAKHPKPVVVVPDEPERDFFATTPKPRGTPPPRE